MPIPRRKGYTVLDLSRKTRETLAGYGFLLPNFLGFLLFTSLPVLASLALSFCNWDLIGPIRFAGMRNFIDLIGCHAADETLVIAKQGQAFAVLREGDNAARLYVSAVAESGAEHSPTYERIEGWIAADALRPVKDAVVVRAQTVLRDGGREIGAVHEGQVLAVKESDKERCVVETYLRGKIVAGTVDAAAVDCLRLPAVAVASRVAPVTQRRIVPNDPDFWKYLANTLFLMMGVPIGMALSLMLALLMNQKLRGILVFRTVYFLPSVTTGVALYMLWRWIYNPDFGLLNTAILTIARFFGIHIKDIPQWLASVRLAKPAIMFMSVWTSVGGPSMIVYLAGLQNIPPELYEAADIDGASRWQKFWNITWPMLSPTTFFLFALGMIGGFQGGFEAAYVMTRGGPAGSTTTISYYIYNNAFVWFHMGYAAAIAWALFVLVFIVTMINWNFGGKVVHYT
ncbi:MAG: sugar ABC transporter permease [Planctomycetota bacterium]